jgi:hypothetical protein
MSETPLQVIAHELSAVATTLRGQDARHGRRTQIADELDGHAGKLVDGIDAAGMDAIAVELKKLAKEILPDDAASARAVAECCLRLHKLAAPSGS